MKEINTGNWQEFQIGKLFQVSRGRRFIVGKHKEGNIPYYSASLENNGITDYISNPLFIDKNAIIVTTFCDAFYAKGEFTASDEITILHHSKMNEINGLFIASAIRKNAWKYSFKVKAFQTRIIEDTIKLPINKKGEPDWEYMESYMKNIMQESEQNIENLQNINSNNHEIESAKWKDFIFGKLFQMQKQKEISPIYAYNKNTHQEIKYPFYGQSSENNGIISYISLEDKTLLNNKENKPIIMIHSNNHLSFYVNSPFYLKDGHGATSLFTNKNLNKYNVFFIISVLNKTMEDKFDYSLKATKEKLNSLKIKLPVDNKGEPDWEYMENYMKNIMEDTQSKLDKLVCC